MLTAAAAPIAIRGLIFDGLPPVRYQNDTRVVIRFATHLNTVCGNPPAGHHWVGCVRNGIVHVSNPCYVGGAYARYLCHEMGHTNGWSRYHEF